MKRKNKGAISDTLPLPLLLLRLYSVLRADSASALPLGTPTSTDATSPESKSTIVPLAIGLTFGLLTLAIAILGAFCLRRRGRRKSVDLLGSNYTPRHSIPPTQRSHWPQESKRPAQTTQPHTLGSSLLSGGPTPVAASTTSTGIAELEMPPSYDSHVRTRGAATAK